MFEMWWWRRRDADALRDLELFAGCSTAELAQLRSLMTPVTVAAGTVLTRRDEPGREFFVLLRGRASVVRDGERVAEVGPGEFVGETALLDRGPRTATVVAETEVEALVLNEQEFHQLLASSHSVTQNMLRVVSQRARAA